MLNIYIRTNPITYVCCTCALFSLSSSLSSSTEIYQPMPVCGKYNTKFTHKYSLISHGLPKFFSISNVRQSTPNCEQILRSGDRIPLEARFSASAQTGPAAYKTSYTTDTGSDVPKGRGFNPPPHPEIPKFGQSSAEFPVLWKIHP
jgi:hypothetical protein